LRPWLGAGPHVYDGPVTCPSCGSTRVIVLVHSLRLLCAACMRQWRPEEEGTSLADVAEAADALAAALDRASERGPSSS
jgi:hypothetical protein